jgi:predicted phage-related endonuclease
MKKGSNMGTVNLNEQRVQILLLRWCKTRKAEIADVERQARAAIEEALGDNESGTVDGELAVTWKTHKRRALDQKALKESHPELVEEFTAINDVRRFEVIDEQGHP